MPGINGGRRRAARRGACAVTVHSPPLGGSIGLGFAIPTNLAVAVAQQLAGSGEVRLGDLGARFSNLTRDLAKAFGLDTASGALVNQIDEGGAAQKAGIERGDVVVSVDGKPVRNTMSCACGSGA